MNKDFVLKRTWYLPKRITARRFQNKPQKFPPIIKSDFNFLKPEHANQPSGIFSNSLNNYKRRLVAASGGPSGDKNKSLEEKKRNNLQVYRKLRENARRRFKRNTRSRKKAVNKKRILKGHKSKRSTKKRMLKGKVGSQIKKRGVIPYLLTRNVNGETIYTVVYKGESEFLNKKEALGYLKNLERERRSKLQLQRQEAIDARRYEKRFKRIKEEIARRRAKARGFAARKLMKPERERPFNHDGPMVYRNPDADAPQSWSDVNRRIIKKPGYELKPFSTTPQKVITERYGVVRKEGPHTGVDIRAPKGTPIMAMKTGYIVKIWTSKGVNQILIAHPDGTTTGYAHVGVIKSYKVGSIVIGGNKFAVSDGSGTRDAHLHQTMYDKGGKRADPMIKLRETGNYEDKHKPRR